EGPNPLLISGKDVQPLEINVSPPTQRQEVTEVIMMEKIEDPKVTGWDKVKEHMAINVPEEEDTTQPVSKRNLAVDISKVEVGYMTGKPVKILAGINLQV